MPAVTTVRGFEVRLDLAYARGSHLWVEETEGGLARVGLDALGVETSGSLAAVDLVPVGTEVRRGDAIGTLEADKFVGPLRSPLPGVVVERNETVPADPGLVQRAPYREGWLVVLVPPAAGWAGELSRLVRGRDAVRSWFEAEVLRARREGVLAW
jgi:glycine cleavage system H protein